jgi:hypothetical protein
MKKQPTGLLGANGRPLRDEQAHRDFRRHALKQTERVVWKFPRLDGIEFGNVRLEDVAAHVANDKHHPVSLEVGRLLKLYVEAFRRDLVAMAKHFPKDRTPQVGVTRDEPRWPIEHVAQHLAAAFIQQVLIDSSEEAALLHPDGPSSKVYGGTIGSRMQVTPAREASRDQDHASAVSTDSADVGRKGDQ